MALIGYARISSANESPDPQIKAIGAVDKLFIDCASVKDIHRPQLEALRSYVCNGSNDVVKVKSVACIARSTRDLLTLLQEFNSKGVSIDFVDNPELSINASSCKRILTVLAAVVDFERDLIKERQREGIALARAKGKYQRRPKLTSEQIAEAGRLVGEGVPKTRVAAQFGVSRWTLHDALAGRGVYADQTMTVN